MKTIILIFIGLTMGSTSMYFLRGNSSKIAYMNSSQVYEAFQMKSELESKLKTVQVQRKNQLDSLMVPLKILASQLETKKQEKTQKDFLLLKENFLRKQSEFDQDNQNLVKQYNDQIWNRINQYVKDYGKEHGYDYILGANGTGTIMYADEAKDITKEIIEFENVHYKGN